MGRFFELFGKDSADVDRFLLSQDWPSTSNVKGTFPFSALCPDLMHVIPISHFTRIDNVASWYPSSTAKPDIGIFELPVLP